MDQNAIISKIKSKSVAKLRINTFAIVFRYRRAHVSRIMLKNCMRRVRFFQIQRLSPNNRNDKP